MSRYRVAANDEQPVSAGEGITVTADPSAKLWPVVVTFTTGGQPMRCTIRAINREQAETFARNRHLFARTITVGEPS